MKGEPRFFILVTFCLGLITACLYLSADLHTATDKVKALTIQVGDLREKNYNDSILVSEYQQALDDYMEIEPKAADDFMKLVEKVNTQP
jgi:hypothetical protein